MIEINNIELLKNASPLTVEKIKNEYQIKHLKKGCNFFSDKSFSPSLIFILSGEVKVYSLTQNKPTLLNTLYPGDTFGVAMLFGGKGNVTSVVSSKDTDYIPVCQEDVENLLKEDFTFAKSYLTYLSEKIRFLNRKISAFTAGSTEKKLAKYILSLPYENGEATLPFSCVKLASSLNMGRASLYRAFDYFENENLFTKQGNIIKFNSRSELEKLYGGNL